MVQKYECRTKKCQSEPAVKLGQEWMCTKHFDEYCEQEPKVLAEQLPQNQGAQEVYLQELYSQNDLLQIRQAQSGDLCKTSIKQLSSEEFSDWTKKAEETKNNPIVKVNITKPTIPKTN